MKDSKLSRIWVAVHVNRKALDTFEQDLIENGYSDITVYIPMVRVLKKCFKNKKEYEDIPFLLNYGFLKIPEQFIFSPDFLRKLKDQIPGIHSWVKDPARMLYDEEADSSIGIHNISIVSSREIVAVKRACRSKSIFNDLEIGQIEKGDEISLKGYPYEGLVGTIIKIDHKNKQVILDLMLGDNPTQVTVDFENIFYTVYEDYEEKSMREDSLDELCELGPRVLDKLYANLTYEESNEDEWN